MAGIEEKKSKSSSFPSPLVIASALGAVVVAAGAYLYWKNSKVKKATTSAPASAAALGSGQHHVFRRTKEEDEKACADVAKLSHIKFSLDEIRAIKVHFKKLQPSYNSGKGSINIDQFKKVLQSVVLQSNGADEDAVHSMYQIWDRDGNGSINFQEFVEGLNFICFATVEEKLRSYFKNYDADNNHMLSEPELRKLLRFMNPLRVDADNNREEDHIANEIWRRCKADNNECHFVTEKAWMALAHDCEFSLEWTRNFNTILCESFGVDYNAHCKLPTRKPLLANGFKNLFLYC